MSLQTWKDEFYPVPAAECKEEDALDHSILKWTGLLKKNLKKHGVKKWYGAIIDNERYSFCVNDDTCALCIHASLDCKDCPIFKSVGRRCDEGPSEFQKFATGDARPMLNLLKRVKREVEKNESES